MEEPKKVDLTKRPKEVREKTGGGDGFPGCPLFIFGDKKSADKDLKKVLDIKE